MQQNVTEELVEQYAKIDIIAEEILTEKHQVRRYLSNFVYYITKTGVSGSLNPVYIYI